MQPSLSGPDILIVDESVLDQIALEQRLRPNFSARFASTVASASAFLDLYAAYGGRLAMVISDYALPDGDGFSVLQHARFHFPNVPRLLMSSGSPSEIDRLLGAGLVTRFVRKPLQLEDLRGLG